MAKKMQFPDVAACATFFDVRQLLPQVRWKSAEYEALMLRWRELCFDQMLILETRREFNSLLEGGKARVWRRVYELCPSGSLEEAVAVGVWQSLMPYDADLVDYRSRVRSEAREAAHTLGLRI